MDLQKKKKKDSPQNTEAADLVLWLQRCKTICNKRCRDAVRLPSLTPFKKIFVLYIAACTKQVLFICSVTGPARRNRKKKRPALQSTVDTAVSSS